MSRRMSDAWTKPVTLILAIALIAGACGSESDGSADGVSQFGSNISITGTSLLPLCQRGQQPPACVEPVNGLDPAVGAVAPSVSATSFDGTPVEISADGTPKVITFLAHWCPHCQSEVKTFASLYPDGVLPGGVELISVATGTTDRRPNYPPSKWLEDEKWAFPVAVDGENYEIASAFGLWAYPFWVVTDGSGTVLLRLAGSLSPAQLDEIIGLISG